MFGYTFTTTHFYNVFTILFVHRVRAYSLLMDIGEQHDVFNAIHNFFRDILYKA